MKPYCGCYKYRDDGVERTAECNACKHSGKDIRILSEFVAGYITPPICVGASSARVYLLGNDKVIRVSSLGWTPNWERFLPLVGAKTRYYPKVYHIAQRTYGKHDAYVLAVMERLTVYQDKETEGMTDDERIAFYDGLEQDISVVRYGIELEATKLGLPVPRDQHTYNFGWDRQGNPKMCDFWM